MFKIQVNYLLTNNKQTNSAQKNNKQHQGVTISIEPYIVQIAIFEVVSLPDSMQIVHLEMICDGQSCCSYERSFSSDTNNIVSTQKHEKKHPLTLFKSQLQKKTVHYIPAQKKQRKRFELRFHSIQIYRRRSQRTNF